MVLMSLRIALPDLEIATSSTECIVRSGESNGHATPPVEGKKTSQENKKEKLQVTHTLNTHILVPSIRERQP